MRLFKTLKQTNLNMKLLNRMVNTTPKYFKLQNYQYRLFCEKVHTEDSHNKEEPQGKYKLIQLNLKQAARLIKCFPDY
jgi:hypothetical protein